jgi:lysophospholipase L1-like esterase
MTLFRALIDYACLALLVGSSATLVAQETFLLKDGDRVVFYGDSITEQRLYTMYIETAVHARYPNWHIRFINSGVGGDRVSGGQAGPIDARIDRDVIAQSPTVITIMLGMNDRSTPETRAAYQPGYEHILQRLRASLPLAHIVLIGPSPYDEITRPARAGAAGNRYLVEFVPIVQALARKYQADFIDFNAPLVAALHRASTLNPAAALMALPDHAHPEGGVHLLMAELILRAWHFPEIAAGVELAGDSGKVLRQQDLSSDGKGHLRWTEEDGPDVVIFDPDDGNEALYRLLSAEPHLGRRMLHVTGLPRGEYRLTVDGKALAASLNAESLVKGVDISQESTPMHAQGRAVYYACQELELLQDVTLRMKSRAAEVPPAISTVEGQKFMEANLHLAEERILKATTAPPQRHSFSLDPAAH